MRPVDAMATSQDPSWAVLASRAENSRLGGPLSRLRPPEITQTGRLNPRVTVALPLCSRARQEPIKETGLTPQPKTLLRAAPRPPSMWPS